MIALLKQEKLMVDGKEISYFDAYKDGKIPLKVNEEIQAKMHAISKRLHGVYNSFDMPMVQRHYLGRMLMMFRKFLIPGFKKRYKAIGI
jgi:hypothetical protein